jgi:DNA modification methylase
VKKLGKKKQKPISNINYIIPPKTHTPMYLMHKYWARKPHNVVAEYIKCYSRKGEIVLDPFVGSGVTAIESLKNGRRAIAIDLDPMAIFITRMTVLPVELNIFRKQFELIKKEAKNKIDSLYETICSKCHKKAIATAFVWKENNPILVRYTCKCSNGTQWKKVSKADLRNIRSIENREIPYWYPDNELIWNTRVNVHKGTKVSDLFTKRNLIALSIIYNEIEAIRDEKTKDILKFTFSSALPQASKMVFVIRKRGRAKGEVKESSPEVGSWATRGYWVPEEFFEIHAWNCFENRFKKVYRGKKESNEKIPPVKVAKDFEDFTDNNRNFLYKIQSALELTSMIPNEAVDYVFTDPPYGDSVPYLELDYMWSSWLKFGVDFDDEIIISDSPIRKEKNFGMYEKMLRKAFREIYRVLKRERYLTVTFHNTDIKIYNLIISSVILAGFELEKVLYQPPARASPKGLLAPYGSAVGDYYIRFKKTLKESLSLSVYSQIDKERYERIIINALKKVIAERGEPTPYSTIINSYPIIYDELKKNGYLFSAPESIEEIMKRNLGKEFVLLDVKNDKGKIVGQKWWLKGVLFLDRVPLSERVEAITIDVLNKEIKVTFDEVIKQVFLKFTNALTPDTQNVKNVLEEYAEKTKDGKWRLKPKVKQRESEHDSIVELLASIGKNCGYDVYADVSGWRNELDISLPKENLDRIKEIDVVWLKENTITHEFEVENTTGITEAIVRGSNIPTLSTKRFIVIPEERKDFFDKRTSEPMLKEKMEELDWRFIYYDAIKTFFERNKHKKHIDASEFEKLADVPKLTREKQQSMKEYL